MTPRVRSIEGNTQRLDGGAMFGNAPRALWERWLEPDGRGRIPLACRAMLVEQAGRRVLLETGIGAFFDPELRDRYGVVEDRHVLLENLEKADAPHDRIDLVILSHLHFDHAGGLLEAWGKDQPARLLFPNARFLVSRAAWERARDPHPRDRASFIPELPRLLEDSGRLEIVDGTTSRTAGDNFTFRFSQGHTPGLMLTELETEHGPLLFAADLIPGLPWMHLPITMGYDRYPERLIDEKKTFLERLLARRGIVFFTHDPETPLARVAQDEKGRFRGDPVEL